MDEKTKIRDICVPLNLFDKRVNMIVYDYFYYHDLKKVNSIGYDIISKCIIGQNKCWEPFQTEITKEILKDGNNVFIDIGTQLGWYSILSSVYNNHTISIDYNDVTIEKFKKTIDINNLKNIRQVKQFIDAYCDIDKLIGDTIKKYGKIKLIKCDIEGNEVSFIEKIFELLKTQKIENMILEISPLLNPDYAKCIMSLINLGYHVYDIGLSPPRKLSNETTLSALEIEKLKFNNVDEITDYMNIFPEKQSNFLFSIDKNVIKY